MINTLKTIPLPLRENFNSGFLAYNRHNLEIYWYAYEIILAIATKKIRKQDVKKKMKFEDLKKNFEELHERKKVEEANKKAKAKKEVEKMSFGKIAKFNRPVKKT